MPRVHAKKEYQEEQEEPRPTLPNLAFQSPTQKMNSITELCNVYGAEYCGPKFSSWLGKPRIIEYIQNCVLRGRIRASKPLKS